MNEPPRCPVCGMALAPGRLEGLCPACTWQGLFESEGGEIETEGKCPSHLLMRIPGYDITREIARGGMGIVYQAEQLEPRRTVALKMLLPQQLGSPGMADRFAVEVRALSELDHPAILPVYQVGEHDRLPFFTMKLATGGTLARRKDQYAGSWREIAGLVAMLADAVQFAHERGVLHRDLKPGNILFDEQERPYVTDFGLAKFASAHSDLTRSVDFLGTPHYVAPEVAEHSARQATTASDIYSLGAIHYELLTGRPPFEAEGMPALMRKIAEEEPKFERTSRRLEGQARQKVVPRDLEVICLKCLAKQPARRYATARELAEDLERWLHGRPITARPVTQAERAWKWVQRNPVLAVMGIALLISLVGGGISLWRSDRKLRRALSATRQAQTQAQNNLGDALLAEARALGAAHGAGQRWHALEALGRAAAIRPSLELRNEVAATLARTDIREVGRFPVSFGEAGSPVVFTSDLKSFVRPEPRGGFALRNTEDRHLLASFPDASRKPARWFVVSPDDHYIAVLQDNYALEIWRLPEKSLPTSDLTGKATESGAQPITRDAVAAAPILRWQGTVQQPPIADFSPDGRSLAGYVAGQGLFLQHFDGSERQLLQSTNTRVIYLRFDKRGERLAVVRDPGGVEVWRCPGTPALLWSKAIIRTVPWLAWSPDGGKLLAAGNDGRGVRVLSAGSGETELVYSRHLLYPRQFEFSPNGRVIASVGQDWMLRLWDAGTGQDLVSSVGRHRVMRFSDDGRRLTTAPTDRELAVLEMAPEQIFREFHSDPSPFVSDGLTRTADGKLLLAGYPQLRLYDTCTGGQVAVRNLTDTATDTKIFFGPDGAAVFYSLWNKGIFRRRISRGPNETEGSSSIELGEEERIAPTPFGMITGIVESGQTWVFHGRDGIEFWPHGEPAQARRVAARGSLRSVTASENARWIAVADSVHQAINVWDTAIGRVITNLPARNPDRVWFSPDNRLLVASVESGYSTWETGTWRSGVSWEARLDSGDPGEITFSDDGHLAAARQERESFRLLSLRDGRELVTLKPPLVLPVRSACLSADGKKLWLRAGPYRIFEWNIAELRKELGRLDLDWTADGR